jgi:TonB-linked SusC/RagA family outer membrane protein
MKHEFKRLGLTKKVFIGSTLFLASVGIAQASPTSDGNSLTSASLTKVSQQAEKTITGTVVDKKGETIIGANVVVKGTTTGTVTDFDGKFTLNVPKGATLSITYIGYNEVEVPVGDQSKLSVVMVEDNQALEEVVVVGYGTQKKVNLTGSVSSVNFEEQALSRPVTNVSSALAGLSSGVQVMQGSGQPGEDGASIRIRGVGTMNNSAPLVIVDGMEGSMDAVNPQDIESISILKDAASSAIYGSRAANGVILITTKKGKVGKLTVNYSGRVSYAQPTNLIDMVTNYADYMELMNEGFENVGQNPHFSQSTIDLWREKAKDPNGVNEIGVPNYVAYPNTDWQNELFQKGLINDHNVSVNGGSEKIRFLLSAGYMDNPGLVDNTGISRYSMRANVDAKITNWLTVGTRTYASMEDKDPGHFKNANNYLRQTTPGLYPEWNGQYGFPEAPEESATANSILWFLNRQEGTSKKSRFNTTMYTKVTFLEGLTWDFNLNYKRRWDEKRNWSGSVEKVRFSDNTLMSPADAPSEMGTSFSNYANNAYTLENILNYSTTFNKDHDFSALLGYQEYYYYEYTNSASKKGLIDQSINVPGSATEMLAIGGGSKDRATRSVFGRLNYAYKSRYLLEANLRYDGSSRYHDDSRWGLFPAFSGAWRVSEEAFMEGTRDVLDNLKLRLSWGELGNTGGDDVGDYEYQSTYGIVNYSFNGMQAAGLATTNIANSVLSWESTAVANLGIDAAMLNSRLTAEFDVYNKVTDGILYRPSIYLTMGEKAAPRLNIAEVTNTGVEFTLGWKDNIGEVNYSVSGNIAYNKNEVTDYKGEYEAGWVENADGERVYKTNLGSVSTGGDARVLEGHTMNEYHLLTPHKGTGNSFNADGSVNVGGGPRDGIIRTEEDMKWVNAMIEKGHEFMPNKKVAQDKIWYGDYIYADNNGDGIYGNSYDKEFQGTSKTPKYNFGLQMAASWRGFDVSMNWAGATGFDLYWGAATGYNSTVVGVGMGLGTEMANNHYFYNPENPADPRTNINGEYPRLTAGGSQNTTASTNFLHNGNYLKLKNLTFGYTLPKHVTDKLLTNSIRFYVSGENLWNINSFPGQDPELGATPEYTSVRQFAFGVNLSF